MTLLALMYHRAYAAQDGNAPAMLDAHFAHIAANYACVLPGEPVDSRAISVCISFDDAYFDFYAVVFPLLVKHRLRALLAVPPVVLRERATVSRELRLRALAVVDRAQPNYTGFCTWEELRELANSGHVEVAAHGFTHAPLDLKGIDLQTEVIMSGSVLGSRLGRPVHSFVLPYGRFNRDSLACVRQHYRHTFRIGGAANRSWAGGMLYRVGADGLTAPDEPFRPHRLAKYRARYYWNRLRGR